MLSSACILAVLLSQQVDIRGIPVSLEGQGIAPNAAFGMLAKQANVNLVLTAKSLRTEQSFADSEYFTGSFKDLPLSAAVERITENLFEPVYAKYSHDQIELLQDTKVSLAGKNITYEEAIQHIAKQAGVKIKFSSMPNGRIENMEPVRRGFHVLLRSLLVAQKPCLGYEVLPDGTYNIDKYEMVEGDRADPRWLYSSVPVLDVQGESGRVIKQYLANDGLLYTLSTTRIVAYDRRRGVEVKKMSIAGASDFAVDPIGKYIILSTPGRLLYWTLDDFKFAFDLSLNSGDAPKIDLSSDGMFLAVSSSQILRVYNARVPHSGFKNLDHYTQLKTGDGRTFRYQASFMGKSNILIIDGANALIGYSLTQGKEIWSLAKPMDDPVVRELTGGSKLALFGKSGENTWIRVVDIENGDIKGTFRWKFGPLNGSQHVFQIHEAGGQARIVSRHQSNKAGKISIITCKYGEDRVSYEEITQKNASSSLSTEWDRLLRDPEFFEERIPFGLVFKGNEVVGILNELGENRSLKGIDRQIPSQIFADPTGNGVLVKYGEQYELLDLRLGLRRESPKLISGAQRVRSTSIIGYKFDNETNETDGRILISGLSASGSVVYSLDAKTGITKTISTNKAGGSAVFSSDGSRYLEEGGQQTGQVRIYNSDGGSLHFEIERDKLLLNPTEFNRSVQVAVNRDGTLLAARSIGGIKIFDTVSGEEMAKIYFDPGLWGVGQLEFSPYHDVLVVTRSDSRGEGGDYIKLLDPRSGRLVNEFNGSLLKFGKKSGKFICVEDRAITVFTVDGGNTKPVRIPVQTSDVLSTVVFNEDEDYVFGLTLSGTILAFDVKQRKHVLSHIALSGGNYMCVAPDRTYIASKASTEAITFHFRGQILPFDQFDVALNRPDKIVKLLGKADESFVRQLELAYQSRLRGLGIRESELRNPFSVPEAPELSPAPPTKMANSSLNFTLSASDFVNGISSVYVRVNGVLVFSKVFENGRVDKFSENVSISLTPGINELEAYTISSSGSRSQMSSFSIDASGSKEPPEVYIIGLGVSQYKYLEKLNGANDAKTLVQFLKTTYPQAKTLLIENPVGNPQEIVKRIDDFLSNARPQDTVISLFSGHGTLIADPTHPQELSLALCLANASSTMTNIEAILYEDLEKAISRSKAFQRLVLIDACYSGEYQGDGVKVEKSLSLSGGSLLKRKMVSPLELERMDTFETMRALFADLRAQSGTVVFSSSSGNQASHEANGRGFFTQAVIDGLKGAADQDGDRQIRVSELFEFVEREVQRTSGNIQRPTLRQENIRNNFVLIRSSG